MCMYVPALLGFATTIIPRWFTYYVSCGLFAVFGIKMLREGNDNLFSLSVHLFSLVHITAENSSDNLSSSLHSARCFLLEGSRS